MVGPHSAGEGVIFTVTDGCRGAAFEVRCQPETNSVALYLNPEMAARGERSPLEQHHRAVLLKRASPLEQVLIDGYQHLGQATFSHYPFGVLAFRLLPGLANPINEIMLLFSIVKVFLLVRRRYNLSDCSNRLTVKLRFVFFEREIIGETEEVIVGSGVGIGKQRGVPGGR